MSDLISRSEAIKLLRKNMSNDIQDQIITENNINLIESLPTAFDTEKVVAELESEKIIHYGLHTEETDIMKIDDAIDIVKKGGVE